MRRRDLVVGLPALLASCAARQGLGQEDHLAAAAYETKVTNLHLPGDALVRLVEYTKPAPSQREYFNLHGNEQASVAAARTMVQYFGGRLFTLEQAGKRYLELSWQGKPYRFDPNRMFSDEGLEKDLQRMNKHCPPVVEDYVRGFRQEVLRRLPWDKNTKFTTVHNNTAGAWTVNSFNEERGYAVAVLDPIRLDDFFLVVNNQTLFDELVAGNYNVVHHGKAVDDDGSLSVYAAKHDLPYVNVETRQGNRKRQAEMLEFLQSVWQ